MRGRSTSTLLALPILAGGVIALAAATGWAMDETPKHKAKPVTATPSALVKPRAKQEEYKVFKKYCTQCHESVADPERPGKTRDEWYRIINLMEGHGLNINQADADLIVDLLYNLRRGIENQPG